MALLWNVVTPSNPLVFVITPVWSHSLLRISAVEFKRLLLVYLDKTHTAFIPIRPLSPRLPTQTCWCNRIHLLLACYSSSPPISFSSPLTILCHLATMLTPAKDCQDAPLVPKDSSLSSATDTFLPRIFSIFQRRARPPRDHSLRPECNKTC